MLPLPSLLLALPASASAASAPAKAPFVGIWSRPPDGPAKVALAVAAALLVLAFAPGGTAWLLERLDFGGATEAARRRRFLVIAAFAAAFLSLGYIAFYLRGGPRSADAAAHWLQGRALSHGELAWATPDPWASYRAKNLLPSPPAPGWLAGLGAPGYPALLALTFLLGAPMLIGPLLAAGLVASTWFLARECAAAAGEDDARRETIGRVAAGLSIASAALRYHTAEAVPYGAAALATALALACAVRGSRRGAIRIFGVAGLAGGMLLATMPSAALAVTLGVVALAAASPAPFFAKGLARLRAVAWLAAGILPGAVLLLLAHRAATGQAFTSAASAYAASFAAPSAQALGLGSRLSGIARCLRAHFMDVANLELLVLALALAAPGLRARWRASRTEAAPAAWAIAVVAVVVVGQWVVAIVSGEAGAGAGAATASAAGPPGAAAMASVIPLEHALGALALAVAFGAGLRRAATATLALALAGFALHASNDHEEVATGGVGRPRFEPDVAREGNVTHGLLFFDDDEGFELAHDPTVLASHGLAAVRMRNDDHDRLLYDLLGHPPSHRYVLPTPVPGATAGASGAAPSGTVVAWSSGSGDLWRFESEADFPMEAPWGGFVDVLDATGSCASGGSVLSLTPAGTAEAGVRIELPVPRGAAAPPRRSWSVTPRVFVRRGARTGASADLALVALAGEPPLAQWSWDDGPAGAGDAAARCIDLPSRTVDLGGDRTRAWLVLTARGGEAALDKTTLRAR